MRVDRVAGVFVGVSGAALDAEPADDREDHVLRVHARTRARPFTSMRRTLSGDIASDCDASTSRTCDVPMPNAIAPNAPCVDVWLSPQHDRHARLRQPQLRADDVDDALRSAGQVEQRDAVRRGNSARAPPSSSRPSGRRNGRACARVGTMWSTVANVRSGARTRHPARAQLVERLRARHFVDQMQADVQLRLPVRQPADGVAVPDFLKAAWRALRRSW